MSKIYAEASQIIDATPEAVYALLSDYKEGHPLILPPQHFGPLTVEKGGQGAGTVMNVEIRAFGNKTTYHLIVSEPEPGRVLVEKDIEQDVTTTFTVDPVNDGRQANVTIGTEFVTAKGLAGVMEKLMTPPVMRMIYKKELRQLNDVLTR